MRDLFMFASMLFFVPMALSDAFIAYALWAWTSVFSPNYYMFGFMSDMRFNFLFAAIALLALTLGARRGRVEWNATQKLLIAFTAHAVLCALFGYSGNPLNAEVFETLIKALIFCLVMPMFVTSRLRLHVLLVVLALGIGFHGLVEGLKFITSGGGHKILGIATSMISDNNHFAVGLLMVVPILFYLYQSSARPVVRLGFLFTFILTTVTVMGTFSRGGFVGLATVGVWMVFTSRRKLTSLFFVVSAAGALYLLAPDAWFERIDTINNAGEDDSFIGRVIAWKISTAIALSNPIFGGGFHAVQALPVWTAFRDSIGFLSFIATPEPGVVGRAAHSIYFEILGDMGFVGLLLFIAIGVNGWMTALSIKRLTAGRPELLWARDLADMLRVSLLVYSVSGAAVSMGYFELFYTIVAAIAVLKRCVVQQSAEAVRVAESSSAVAMSTQRQFAN